MQARFLNCRSFFAVLLSAVLLVGLGLPFGWSQAQAPTPDNRPARPVRPIRPRQPRPPAAPPRARPPLLTYEFEWPPTTPGGAARETPDGLAPGTKLPVVISLHGTGENLSDGKLLVRQAAQGQQAVILAIRGPRTVPPNKRTATRFGWGGRRTPSIATTIAAALKAQAAHLDTSRVAIVGHRQGGYYALRVALATPGRYQGVLAVNSGITRTTFARPTLLAAKAEGLKFRLVNATTDTLGHDAAKAAVSAWVALGLEARFVSSPHGPDLRAKGAMHVTAFLRWIW